MKSLANATAFTPPIHKWKPDERAELLAELDAAFFILYGLTREEVEYVLSTFVGTNSPQNGLFDGLSVAERIIKHFVKLC